jgi:hypothetical protein
MSEPTPTEAWQLGIEAEEFLTPDEIRHYNRFLGSGGYIVVHPREDNSWQWSATVIHPATPPQERGQLMRELAGYRAAIEPGVIREGYGAEMCSASQVLAPSPGICWDVCGYYRRLGVHWRATRRQLLEAAMASGITIGAGDPWRAYALAQLLDPAIRREYDMMPLGALFLKDAYVNELLKREAHRVATEMYDEDGENVTVQDILAGMGYSAGQGGTAAGERPEAPTALPRASGRDRPWMLQWSWYRLAGDADISWRAEVLERWQLMLVRAFDETGMPVRFSVGLYTGWGVHVRHGSSPGSLIIFLGRDEPTQQLARNAVEHAQLVLQP